MDQRGKCKPAINGVTLPNAQEALTQLDPKRVDDVFYDAGGNERCCIGRL